MKRIILIIALLVPFSAALATTTQHDTLVHFTSDEHQLTPEAGRALDVLLQRTVGQGEPEFTIAGHTDSDADHSYNERLARRRSDAVRAYLIGHGVPEASVRISAFGERKAIASNASEEGQALNRRVQVTAVVHRWETTADLTARLRQGAEQVFRIDP